MKKKYRTSAKFSKSQIKARARIRAELKSYSEQVSKLEKSYSSFNIKSVKEFKEKLNKVGLLTKSGNIRKVLPRTFKTTVDIKAVDQSIKQFNKSNVNSVERMQTVLKEQRKYIEKHLPYEVTSKITDEELFEFNYIFEDESYESLSKVYSSTELVGTMYEAIDKGLDKEEFINKLSLLDDKVNSDVTTRNAAESIYNKYLSILTGNEIL